MLANRALALILFGVLGTSSALTIEEDSSADDAKPVFYTITMANMAQKHQVKLWLASLREVGKWTGAVVIVTDWSDCIEKTLGPKYLGGEREYSDNDVDVYPGLGDGGKIHVLKVKSAPFKRDMKLHKTNSWVNVAKAKVAYPVSSIIFTDTDIVIGKDTKAFVQNVRDLEKKQFTMATFHDRGGAGSQGQLHTGVVASFNTPASQQCMQAWGANIHKTPAPNSHPYNPLKGKKGSLLQTDLELTSTGIDQAALLKTGACRTGSGIQTFADSYLSFPTTGSMKAGSRAEFVHITNTERAKEIPRADQKAYFKKIGVDSSVDPFKWTQCDYKQKV